MSLANFSLPFPVATPSYHFSPSLPEQTSRNNLRLNAVLPVSSHFHETHQFQNQPYLPPTSYHRQYQLHNQERSERRNHQQYKQQQQTYPSQHQYNSQNVHNLQNQQQFPPQTTAFNDYDDNYRGNQPRQENLLDQEIRPPLSRQTNVQDSRISNQDVHQTSQDQEQYNEQPEGYTQVHSGSYGNPKAKTSVHAIIDYDDDETATEDDDYYDESIPQNPRVTPIQGPIFLKNGTVPVVPLYSYPKYNNGTFVQIPILWTALSVALGVELRGDLVRGTPCIKKYHQLFCPTAGKTYPIERIELFIDENKALMKRMYGDFEMDKDHGPETSSSPRRRKRRSFEEHDLPDGGPRLRKRDLLKPEVIEGGDSFFSQIRNARQVPRNISNKNNHSETGRVDVCESKVEIVTPYWASNSAGKIRAVVNTQHFEQAIHQEVCSKTQTNRCSGECGCEQKYKWHRLLAYDPQDDCKGIFMDWFLFPSCCVCRCDPHAKSPGTATMNNRNG